MKEDKDIDYYNSSSASSSNAKSKKYSSSKSTSASSLPRSSYTASYRPVRNYSQSNYKVYSEYNQRDLEMPGKRNFTKSSYSRVNEHEHESKKYKQNQDYLHPKRSENYKSNKYETKNRNFDIERKKVESKPEPEIQAQFEDTLIQTFIGSNTFECDNVFADLISQDLVLVCLESKSKNEKNSFCFKGKCSLRLIHGEVQINGYYLKNDTHKWVDLYSPETNSYLSIANSRSSNEMDQIDVSSDLLNKIKDCLSLTLENSMDQKLQDFLQKNNFSPNSSSLFILRSLKSQFCNYISYFENFQHIYQSQLVGSKNDIVNLNLNSSEIDSLMAKLGIYPVPSNFFNAIHVESLEEKTVVNEILTVSDELTTENVNDQSPIIMACGGKDVGKSTFLRYLINSLLNKYQKVAYLDCDPGQCEFTLGSCISLSLITEPIFGPPHTHISHSDPNKKSYFLGHLSPNDVPGVYLKYIQQCITDFESFKTNEKIPLIVNTMGWNQGLGLCLLKEGILMFKPTHLIQINHPVEANKNMPVLDYNWVKTSEGWPPVNKRSQVSDEKSDNLVPSENPMEIDLADELKYKLITLKSGAPFKSTKYSKQTPQKRLSPRDHRTIAIIAYFSKLHDYGSYFKPIHHLRPYRLPWSKFALFVTHSRVDYEQFFRVFNASLVSLSQVDSKYIKRKEENLDLPGYLSSTVQNDSVIRCLGFGIVRGINIESKEFYILTSEPIEVLNEVNLLCKGMLNLPLEFFFEQDLESPSPYMSYSDSLQNKSDSFSAVCNEPAQRKYLVHQTQSKKF